MMVDSKVFPRGPQVFTIILAGGEGSRLYNLTKRRAKPAVRFNHLSLLEIMLNLVESAGFSMHVDIYGEYLPDSLTDIILSWQQNKKNTWVRPFTTGRAYTDGMTRGTGEALLEQLYSRRKWNRTLRISDEDSVYLSLSADHVTNLDIRSLVLYHLEEKNDVTLSVAVVDRDAAKGLGVLKVDESGNVYGFEEKSDNPTEILDIPGYCYVNMANIVYKPSLLDNIVKEFNPVGPRYDQSEHILKRLIDENNQGIRKLKIKAYMHSGYWSDVGTLDALIDANYDLIETVPEMDVYHISRTLDSFSTKVDYANGPGGKTSLGTIGPHSYVNAGSIVSGKVDHSVLSYNVSVELGAEVVDSVIFDDSRIDAGAKVKGSLLDKDVYIGKNAVLDPVNLPFWLENGEIVGSIPDGYQVTRIGKEGEAPDHLLIQVNWGDFHYEMQKNRKFIEEDSIESAKSGKGIFEAVLTPKKRLVVSKYSVLPEECVFGVSPAA
jgi:glucose-1-phosphate adenylyltransferase